MPDDDPFRRYQGAGADFLELARVRVEEFLTELARMGASTQREAQSAVDEAVEGSRRGTEFIINSIREEIASQLSLLGVATKRDLDDLERRLIARFSTPASSTPVAAAVPPVKKALPAKKARSTEKQGPAKKPAPVKKAAGKKGAAKKAGPAMKAGPAEKATGEA